MPCSCIAHSHLMYTPLSPLPCLGLYLVSSFLACHVYLILCSIVFLRCFVFCFELHSFVLYPSCIITLVHIFFLSLFLLGPFVYSCQKGEKYTGEYSHFYMILVQICRGRNFIGEMHIPKGRKHPFIKKTMFCFVLLFVCFLVYVYGVLSYI